MRLGIYNGCLHSAWHIVGAKSCFLNFYSSLFNKSAFLTVASLLIHSVSTSKAGTGLGVRNTVMNYKLPDSCLVGVQIMRNLDK